MNMHRYPLLVRIILLGTVVIASLGIPLVVGIWADRRWEMYPWLTLAGMVVGVTIATGNLWWLIRRTYAELAGLDNYKDEE
ncbi:MAG TPA: AtpZ/AtpI family protein [Caldilineae bacterium]|nr:AtpZ/AtpI family protein [Caldilineae bacterium]